MFWEALLYTIQPLVTFSPLVKNNIYDFVIFADVFCGFGHEGVDGFAEKADVSLGV